MIRATRQILRRRLPAAHDLVYDNYNFFVIGYCTTERPSDCLESPAVLAKPEVSALIDAAVAAAKQDVPVSPFWRM